MVGSGRGALRCRVPSTVKVIVLKFILKLITASFLYSATVVATRPSCMTKASQTHVSFLIPARGGSVLLSGGTEAPPNSLRRMSL